MKTKLWAAVAIALTFTVSSCTKSELFEDLGGNRPVSFKVSMGKTTKSVAEVLTLDNKPIKMYAYTYAAGTFSPYTFKDKDGNVISGSSVFYLKWDNTTSIATTHTATPMTAGNKVDLLFPNDNTVIYFVGSYAGGKAEPTITDTGGNIKFLAYSSDPTRDVVVATATGKFTQNAMYLAFGHIESQINFKAVAASHGIKVNITNFTINGVNKTNSSFDIWLGTNSSMGWGGSLSNPQQYDLFNDLSMNAPIVVDFETPYPSALPGSITAHKDRYQIALPTPSPQSYTYSLTYSITDYTDNVLVSINTKTANLPITTITSWQKGHRYNYLLSFTYSETVADALSVSGGVTLTDWVDDADQPIDIN